MVLRLRGLNKAITEDNVDEVTDIQAKLTLYESMDENHRSQVMGCTTAKAIMSRLDLIYADNSAANVYRMMLKYYRYRKDPSDSMSVHIGKMDQMRMALKDIQKDPDEEVYQITLLGSLPTEYDGMLEIWELTHPTMKTTANLVARLLKKEEDLNSTKNHQALVIGKYTKEEWDKLPIAEKKKVSRCKKCGKKGHWFKECEEKSEKPQTGGRKHENITLVFNLGNLDSNLSNKWVIDSGASSHMSHKREWFSELSVFSKRISCTVGDGNKVEVVGVGTVPFISIVEGREMVGELKDVLFIPSLATNLVSIGATTKQGIVSCFRGNRCTLTKNDAVVAIGEKFDDNLYILNIESNIKMGNCLLIQKSRSLTEWHKALGHASKERIETLANESQGDIVIQGKESTIQCEDCPEGKGKCNPHPRVYQRASKIGEKVSVDLSGKVSDESLLGYNYYLVSKDDYSEYCHVYPVRDKSAVVLCIEKLIVEFEHDSDCSIRTLCSDNGSEFVNRNTELLLLRERIIHETASAYTPQQNARIEREIGSITNMARTLLLASQLPVQLWPEAIESAVYIRNRLPTKHSKVTPYERFTGRKPIVKHIIGFGTCVHVIRKWSYMTKFDPRTEAGKIVGYTRRCNTYKVYLTKTKRVIETSDIIIGPHKATLDETPAVATSNDEVKMTFNALNEEEGQNVGQLDEVVFPGPSIQTNQVSNEELIRQRKLLSEFFSEMRGEETEGDPLEGIPEESHPQETHEEQIEEMPPPVPQHQICPFEGNEIPRTPIRRSSRERRPPRHHLYAIGLNEAHDDIEPETFNEAVTGKHSEQWKKAIKAEIEAHEENGTWEMVKTPQAGTLLTAKWVFTIKRDTEGNIQRFKARLVARGFQQRQGIDFEETFAPVARIETLRTLLAICAAKEWIFEQFDITTAFLNGKLKEEVYLTPPEGVKAKSGMSLKLHKALYGLKQAPKAWNDTFNQAMKELGFIQTESDPCVFIQSPNTIVAVYVDDGFVISPSKDECLRVINDLDQRFKMKRVENGTFLGMELSRVDDGIIIHQRHYIDKVLARYNMAEATGKTSPTFDQKQLYVTDNTNPTTAPYRQAIGSIQYCGNCTRPDLLFPTNLLARFNQDPNETHWVATKSILRYMKSTRDYSIKYKSGPITIEAYSDADYGGDNQTRDSTSGGIIKLASGPIVFFSRRQSNIAISSTESEYVAACEVVRELKWLRQLLGELGISYQLPTLFIDNMSSIKQIKGGEILRRSKHIEIKYHFVRRSFLSNEYKISHIPSGDQLADYMTKLVSGPKLRELTFKTGLASEETRTRRSNSSASIMGAISKVSLGLVLMLGILSATTGIKFEKGERVIWIPTDHYIDQGVEFYDIEYKYVNPCDLLNSTFEIHMEESRYNINRRAVERLVELCENDFKHTWIPAVNRFINCEAQQPSWYGSARRIYKRFIIWFWIAGMIIISIVSAITATTVVLDRKINTVNASLTQALEEIHILRAGLQKEYEINNGTLQALEDISIKTDSIVSKMEEFATLVSELHWTGNFVYRRMEESKEALMTLTEACEKEQIDTKSLAYLLEMQSLRKLTSELTKLDVIRRIDHNTVNIRFTHPYTDKHTRVFKVLSFKYWVNLTSHPMMLDYDGPEYLIHNYTSNCTKGIDQPETDAIYESCMTKDYGDPRLQLWKSSEPKDEIPPPEIKKTRSHTFVYCMFNNITIENETVRCPPFVIKFPILQSFETHGIVHNATFTRVNATNTIQPIPVKHFNSSLHDHDDFDNQMALISSIRKLNRALGEAVDEKNSHTFPWGSPSVLAVNAFSIVSVAITIACCVYKMCKGKSVGHSEYVTVVNNPAPLPPPVPVPMIPEIEPQREYHRMMTRKDYTFHYDYPNTKVQFEGGCEDQHRMNADPKLYEERSIQ